MARLHEHKVRRQHPGGMGATDSGCSASPPHRDRGPNGLMPCRKSSRRAHYRRFCSIFGVIATLTLHNTRRSVALDGSSRSPGRESKQVTNPDATPHQPKEEPAAGDSAGSQPRHRRNTRAMRQQFKERPRADDPGESQPPQQWNTQVPTNQSGEEALGGEQGVSHSRQRRRQMRRRIVRLIRQEVRSSLRRLATDDQMRGPARRQLMQLRRRLWRLRKNGAK